LPITTLTPTWADAMVGTNAVALSEHGGSD
jgi:hypothetical protein